MAAGFWSKPGTKYGPCEGECGHTDCAQTREMAAAHCRVCGEPIGYERRYYQEENWTVFVHEVCLSDEIEASLAASAESRRVTS